MATGTVLHSTCKNTQLCLQKPQIVPSGAQSSTCQSLTQHHGESGGALETAPGIAWKPPKQSLPGSYTTSLEATISASQNSTQYLREPGRGTEGAPSIPWDISKQSLQGSYTASWEATISASQSSIQHVGEPAGAPEGAPRNTSDHSGLQSLLSFMSPKKLGMDCCGRSQRRVLPEPASRAQQTLPPRLSRVNGWSKPLHRYQAVSWAMFVTLALAMFGIFIPMLPGMWKYIVYGVSGGMLLFHVIVYLVCVSIDPGEDNVRRKIYGEPLPVFDRSKQHHVIEDLYCCLCGVTVSEKAKHCRACNKCIAGFDHHCKWLNNCIGSRNYGWFFSSLASASAWLLCVVSVLLYIVIQYQVDPLVLRTDPQYKDIKSQNTWLLFLPYFHVEAKTPVFVIIAVLVLVLDLISLLLIGQLFIFHLYLMSKGMSTYNYLNQSRRHSSSASSRNKIPSFRKRILPE
ncbi:probable palmitoyltransferase ZDHHC11B [Eptesicus fuscus]|uniref:probable palmitoyltransferase ZDHHC11B n=1 Tax=Eptesicus fuscus TaxID=29078 RepID=UPI0024041B3C|nr:probable palmitoyltransferase ZDHHC11B [Eptesicus fuscus]